MTDLHLTQRELDIMGVLWELGEGTVTEVRDRVDPDLAYTSISSMIRTLELKGFVSHRRGEGKTHVYFPVIAPEAAGESGECSTRFTADRRSSCSRTSCSRSACRPRSWSACAISLRKPRRSDKPDVPSRDQPRSGVMRSSVKLVARAAMS